MPRVYRPEGMLIDTEDNRRLQRSTAALQEAMYTQTILEARAILCDGKHDLIVDLGCCKGIIPRAETALGIEEGALRDIAIISRVNKPVCFVVSDLCTDPSGNPLAVLSRRRVQQMCQQEYIAHLTFGDVIAGRITHMENFGSFVDIGCGITSLIPIDAISVSRISHPRDRFHNGQNIRVVVKLIDEDGRITLSHKELLGTWEENARLFSPGETVAGLIRSVESYGIFVELTPNLAGLAEPKEDAVPGQQASVYIKNLIPEKMKVKLIIVDSFEAHYQPPEPTYFLTESHIDQWRYSPACSERIIETIFDNVDTAKPAKA